LSAADSVERIAGGAGTAYARSGQAEAEAARKSFRVYAAMEVLMPPESVSSKDTTRQV
jgi:hypothetical protein